AIDRLDDTTQGREGGVRWKLLDALSRVGTGIAEETDLSNASPSREAFIRQLQEIQVLLEKSIDEGSKKAIRDIVRLILNTIDWPSIDTRINKYIVEKLPVFVYFENYAILSGRLDLAIDGDYLRLWVADATDGSRVELEQSSKGFQWFLSFYIVFMTETLQGKDTVLLLDEPGLHLHAAAQQDLLRVLAKLSEKN